MNGIIHAYDRQLPVEEDILSNFYLPSGKVYLQYWGSDNFTDIEKENIQAIYHNNQFNLIEIESKEIDRLDDTLPAKLKEFGISAY